MIEELSPTDIGVTATAILGVGSALYALYDKLKTRWEISSATAVKLEAERASNEAARASTAVEQWQRYVEARERQHNLDVERLREEISENRKEIKQLTQKLSSVSGLEQQIINLKDENEQMRTAFRRMGMWPDDDIPPWLEGMPDRRANKSDSGKWYIGPERRSTEQQEKDKADEKRNEGSEDRLDYNR